MAVDGDGAEVCECGARRMIRRERRILYIPGRHSSAPLEIIRV